MLFRRSDGVTLRNSFTTLAQWIDANSYTDTRPVHVDQHSVSRLPLVAAYGRASASLYARSCALVGKPRAHKQA